jgi:hypothetical protein
MAMLVELLSFAFQVEVVPAFYPSPVKLIEHLR